MKVSEIDFGENIKSIYCSMVNGDMIKTFDSTPRRIVKEYGDCDVIEYETMGIEGNILSLRFMEKTTEKEEQ